MNWRPSKLKRTFLPGLQRSGCLLAALCVFNTSSANADVLPPLADFEKIATDLQRAMLQEKSEYETISAYKTRQEKFRFRNGAALDAEITVSVKANKEGCVDRYDAERQELQVICTLYRTLGTSSIKLSRIDSYIGSYTAANAFNHQVEVKKLNSKFQELELAFDPRADRYQVHREFTYSISIPVTPGKAKKIRSQLGLAFSFVLIEPFYSREKIRSVPTIDNPYDGIYDTRKVYGLFKKAMIYDIGTGQVYGSFVYRDDQLKQVE